MLNHHVCRVPYRAHFVYCNSTRRLFSVGRRDALLRLSVCVHKCLRHPDCSTMGPCPTNTSIFAERSHLDLVVGNATSQILQRTITPCRGEVPRHKPYIARRKEGGDRCRCKTPIAYHCCCVPGMMRSLSSRRRKTCKKNPETSQKQHPPRVSGQTGDATKWRERTGWCHELRRVTRIATDESTLTNRHFFWTMKSKKKAEKYTTSAVGTHASGSHYI